MRLHVICTYILVLTCRFSLRGMHATVKVVLVIVLSVFCLNELNLKYKIFTLPHVVSFYSPYIKLTTGFPVSSILRYKAKPISPEHRARLVRERCAAIFGGLYNTTNSQFRFENRVFLINSYNLSYCSVGKAASSNFKRVVLYFQKNRNKKYLSIVNPHNIYLFKNETLPRFLDKGAHDRILKTHYNIVFVRDPIARAISAYRDKFYSRTDTKFHDYFRRVIGKAICKSLQRFIDVAPSTYDPYKNLNIDCNNNYFDLEAFLVWLFIVPNDYKPNLSDAYNPHWSNSISLCRICNTHNFTYHFVGHFERFGNDVNVLMKKLRWDFPFPRTTDTTISEEERIVFQGEVDGLNVKFIKEIQEKTKIERYLLGYIDSVG